MAAGAREHGGDPRRVMAEAGIAGAPGDLLDLSTGINPVPYRFRPLPASAWADLPGQDEMQELLKAARAYYEVPVDGAITAAPGSQALIQLVPRLIPAGSVRIVGPTYNEHEHVWSRVVSDVQLVGSLSEASGADAVVVVNPNNPDGRAANASEMLEVAKAQTRKGGWLIVDEAFADTQPDLSSVSLCSRFNVLVLKSFGKFFGLAGLRLGFLAGPLDLVRRAEMELGPWAVSGPALAIAAEAFANRTWQAECRNRLTADAGALDELLARHGLAVLGGTTLFRLVRMESAITLHRALLERGIGIRRFSAQPDWLRFGVPTEAVRQRLASALEEIFGS